MALPPSTAGIDDTALHATTPFQQLARVPLRFPVGEVPADQRIESSPNARQSTSPALAPGDTTHQPDA